MLSEKENNSILNQVAQRMFSKDFNLLTWAENLKVVKVSNKVKAVYLKKINN